MTLEPYLISCLPITLCSCPEDFTCDTLNRNLKDVRVKSTTNHVISDLTTIEISLKIPNFQSLTCSRGMFQLAQGAL